MPKIATFSTLLLMTIHSTTAYAENPSKPPTGLSIGTQINSLFGTGLALGIGFGETWRLEAGVSASASKDKTTQKDAEPFEQAHTVASLNLNIQHQLVGTTHNRLYIGLHNALSHQRIANDNETQRSWSVTTGPVFGAEQLFRRTLSLAIEGGLVGGVRFDDLTDQFERESLFVQTQGQIIARYYF